MESLKQRMAKASTVAVRRESLTKQYLAAMFPAPSEGVVHGRPFVPVVELPTVFPNLLHHQPCSTTSPIVTKTKSTVNLYVPKYSTPACSRVSLLKKHFPSILSITNIW